MQREVHCATSRNAKSGGRNTENALRACTANCHAQNCEKEEYKSAWDSFDVCTTLPLAWAGNL
eukprot:1952915-Pleurochrysis_carterae.AAC.3